MGNFTINALSSQGSQRSLDKAGRVLENSELHCSALLTSCSRLLKLTPTSKIEHEVEVKPYEQLLKEGPSSATWPCLLAKARSSTPRTSLLCCASG